MENTAVSKQGQTLAETTLKSIRSLKDVLTIHLGAVSDQRTNHPNGKPHHIGEDALAILHKRSSALRETGEAINFNVFSCAVDQIEKLLNKLRTPVQYRRTDIIGDLMTVLDNLENTLKSHE